MITILMESNFLIGGVPLHEIHRFETREERDAWVKANLERFGGFPTVYEFVPPEGGDASLNPVYDPTSPKDTAGNPLV